MSKKRPDTAAIANELQGSSVFFDQAPNPTTEVQESKPVNQSADRSVDQSISQSTKRESNPVVERPKAFYITKRLDHRLDEAVRYLQEKHGIKKVDRSALMNSILDNEVFWTEEALDLLVDRVISQLTSRLTG